MSQAEQEHPLIKDKDKDDGCKKQGLSLNALTKKIIDKVQETQQKLKIL